MCNGTELEGFFELLIYRSLVIHVVGAVVIGSGVGGVDRLKGGDEVMRCSSTNGAE